jgi:hypothetical protein
MIVRAALGKCQEISFTQIDAFVISLNLPQF